MSARRTSGTSRPSLGAQVLAVFSFISKGKSQFKKCLGKRLDFPDILLPDIRGLLKNCRAKSCRATGGLSPLLRASKPPPPPSLYLVAFSLSPTFVLGLKGTSRPSPRHRRCKKMVVAPQAATNLLRDTYSTASMEIWQIRACADMVYREKTFFYSGMHPNPP